MIRIKGRVVFNSLLLLFCTSILLGCGKSDKGIELVEDKKVRFAERYQMVSLSEAGVIYDDSDTGLVWLATIDEGEQMEFCYDPNCKHIPATFNRPDSECMASHYIDKTQTMYYEGCVYFFVQNDIFEHSIYKMKTDGAGRELVARLPFDYNIAHACIFKEDKVYYHARVGEIDELTNNISLAKRIVEVNLLDGSYRFITEETKDTVLQMDMGENTLYIRRANASDGWQYIAIADIETQEEKILISNEEYAHYACMEAYDGDSYFCIDRDNSNICIRNIDGTIEQILVQGAPGEEFGWPDASCDGLFYQRTIAYGDEAEGYYFLDLTTGKVTNITEEKDKYGIVGYDGYYDVFVARDEDFNWTLWSKEKVLGEAKE